jgi:hypothetical protein
MIPTVNAGLAFAGSVAGAFGVDVINVGGQMIATGIGLGVVAVFCQNYIAAASDRAVSLISNGTCTSCDAPRA